MSTIKAVLKKNKKKPNGEYPIYLRITKNRKTKYVALGIYMPEKDWDEVKSKAKNSHPNSGWVNNLIADRVAKAEARGLELDIKNKPLSSLNFKEAIKGKSSSSLFDFADKKIKRLEKSGQYPTSKRYGVVINKLKEYKNNSDLLLEDITVEFLNDYEAHLLSLGNRTNTVHTNLKTIRAILYQAIKEGLFPQEKNPFFQFKLKWEKTQKGKLSYEELKKIRDLKLEEGSDLWNARNLFMFSFYMAGIRFSDIVQLRWKNVVENNLEYKMSKTGNYVKHEIIAPAKIILDIYALNEYDDDYIFPCLKNEWFNLPKKLLYDKISSKNTSINKCLKTIGKKAEITTPISFHIARHSWADLARKKNMNLYDISKALKHSNLKVTETYFAGLDDENLNSEMSRVIEGL